MQIMPSKYKMINKIKKCKLSKLFKILLTDLERKKCDLLVGAGISSDLPSCKPLAKGLIGSSIKGYLRPAEFNINIQICSRLVELRPEFFYQIIYEEIGENIFNLLYELKGGCPNCFHHSIVKLIEHGYINVIFTTNFDTLIETAAEGKVKLLVVKSNSEAIKWIKKPEYPVLIKLHGCITNEDSIRTTLQSVGNGLPDSFTKIIQNRLETQKLLVMGYSGLDHFDIVPALNQISYEKQIYFIQHNSNNSNIAYINPSSKITKDSNAFLSCFSMVYFYEGITRDFFYPLISSLNIGTEKYINKKTKSININHFNFYKDKYIDSLKRGLILGRLLSLFGNFKICLVIYKKLFQSAKARNDEYNISVIECDIASLKSESGKPKEAIKILEKVIRKSSEEELRIPLLLLGNAYLSVGYFKKALYVYQRAEYLKGWDNDKKGLALLYNNLGISQDKIGSHIEAIDSFRKAIKVHKDMGDVDGIIDSKINLAMVYESKSEYDKAKEILVEVEKLANYIQNPKEILIIKGNLGYLYHLTGEIDKSITYLTEALKLSKEIQDDSSISRNLANLAQLYEDNHDFRSAFFLRKREINITKRLGDKASLGTALQNCRGPG